MMVTATGEDLRSHKMLVRSVHGDGRCAQFMEDCEVGVLAEAR